MTISVTQKDIDIGKPGEAYLCPLALAIRRITKRRCCVRYQGVVFNVGRGENHPLPKGAVEFLKNFDGALAVEPFTFELDI